MNKIRFSYTTALVLVVLLISGCVAQQVRTRSSVVDYLYPKNVEVAVEPSVPVLALPINVGIAFVPEQDITSIDTTLWAGVAAKSPLSEAEKFALLNNIVRQFKQFPFINKTEVIPSAYLTPGGGFANLDQIRTMYGIDVIALVSYDQVQFTDEGLLSLSYWTLVGAYVISGEKNDTSTMLDTAVYDIASRKLLFRAPGTDSTKSSATPVNLSEALREDSRKSFNAASDQMVKNLIIQLDQFKETIKANPEQVKIVQRDGYTSQGGSFGGIDLGLLFLILGIMHRNRLIKLLFK